MKMKAPDRPNFSKYGKKCDQTLYHDNSDTQIPHFAPVNQNIDNTEINKKQQGTYIFKSVSRQKRGNFRFPLKYTKGQFSQYPNHFFGLQRSPSWSFAKKQRYEKAKFNEFQMCEKHPHFKQNPQLQNKTMVNSFRESLIGSFKNKQTKMHKSNSFFSAQTKHTLLQSQRDYSIISPRQTSPSGFFNQTKISKKRYISKQQLMKIQKNIQDLHYIKRIQPKPQGYINFKLQKKRQPLKNSKGFQKLQYPNLDENQFKNFTMTQYPISPQKHINFQLHLDRPDYTPTNKLGPNPLTYDVSATRINQSNINIKLGSFRNQIKTRYDRVEPQPNTRLDYNIQDQRNFGMVQMDRMKGRGELFPVVDPAIKKQGDKYQKQILKKQLFVYQINEALRPTNNINYKDLCK